MAGSKITELSNSQYSNLVADYVEARFRFEVSTRTAHPSPKVVSSPVGVDNAVLHECNGIATMLARVFLRPGKLHGPYPHTRTFLLTATYRSIS